VILEADRNRYLRARRSVSIAITATGAMGVIANLAGVSSIATAILTIMTIVGAIGWASYSADLYAMQIAGPPPHRRRRTPN